MALIKKPVNGMKDILPDEMELRDYLMSIIKTTYKSFGFSCMETPCVEHIENLLSKQGGDNEKLIFKIMKRGEKLNLENAQSEADLADSGLRYDLTLPLARYYSNNSANLPNPFKALQIGSVWRADRPQKGRFRQFTQCDIDILGEAGNTAEIELIIATTKALSRICPGKKFEVRINDRRILKGMADYAGFPEDSTDTVFVILDKMDKIGEEGVKAELLEAGFSQESIDKYMDCVAGNVKLEEIAPEAAANIREISDTVNACRKVDFELIYDPTLVRGMGYYTGTIFEVSMEGFGGSVAGGGRYDRMIGRFTGQDTPACGFSIGFERIITILTDSGFRIPDAHSKTAYLYEKGMDSERLAEIIRMADEARDNGDTVLVARMNKNKKFQKEQLTAEGYTEFKEFYNEEMKR
ncbi:MAG: histidine--tRNA ligase [Lachnospiraceae bacterium]|nr:histidine--tRNA ligase [Candidatus Darwinimomas equi]